MIPLLITVSVPHQDSGDGRTEGVGPTWSKVQCYTRAENEQTINYIVNQQRYSKVWAETLWQEMEKQKVLEELLLEELLLDELLLEEHHAEVPELHHREHRNLHLLY